MPEDFGSQFLRCHRDAQIVHMSAALLDDYIAQLNADEDLRWAGDDRITERATEFAKEGGRIIQQARESLRPVSRHLAMLEVVEYRSGDIVATSYHELAFRTAQARLTTMLRLVPDNAHEPIITVEMLRSQPPGWWPFASLGSLRECLRMEVDAALYRYCDRLPEFTAQVNNDDKRITLQGVAKLFGIEPNSMTPYKKHWPEPVIPKSGSRPAEWRIGDLREIVEQQTKGRVKL